MIMSHKNRHHANSLEASKFPSRKTTAWFDIFNWYTLLI
jgi:hypothetical protein